MTHEPHGVTVQRATQADVEPWLALRQALWPQRSRNYHRTELNRLFLSLDSTAVAFLARNAAAEAVGFAEASLRYDYVNGCSTSPVLFLEGIFVRPADRRTGVARALCDAVAGWGRAQGCTEFASDASIVNAASHALHAALGFEETQRVVYFRKGL